MKKLKIGIDIGGVISDFSRFSLPLKSFTEVPPIYGAQEAIDLLGRNFEIYLVSHVARNQRALTWAWLIRSCFFKNTCVPRENVRLIGLRDSKLEVAKELGLAVFIDNRIKVLRPMIKTIPHLIAFRPETREVYDLSLKDRRKISIVYSWLNVVENLVEKNVWK